MELDTVGDDAYEEVGDFGYEEPEKAKTELLELIDSVFVRVVLNLHFCGHFRIAGPGSTPCRRAHLEFSKGQIEGSAVHGRLRSCHCRFMTKRE